jgi:hypothetical protein
LTSLRLLFPLAVTGRGDDGGMAIEHRFDLPASEKLERLWKPRVSRLQAGAASPKTHDARCRSSKRHHPAREGGVAIRFNKVEYQ